MPFPIRRSTPQPKPRQQKRPQVIFAGLPPAIQGTPPVLVRGVGRLASKRVFGRLVVPPTPGLPIGPTPIVTRGPSRVPIRRTAGQVLVVTLPIAPSSAIGTITAGVVRNVIDRPKRSFSRQVVPGPPSNPISGEASVSQGIARLAADKQQKSTSRSFAPPAFLPPVNSGVMPAIAAGKKRTPRRVTPPAVLEQVRYGIQSTTEIQGGITGGPPGNNTAQTDAFYEDANSTGWMVGAIPAYGGAVVSPWYEIDAGARSITQTNLGTSSPDGFIHVLAQNTSSVFTGTETPTFTLTEISPSGSPIRRYWDSGTMAPSSGPPLQYRVRTCVQPGEPGFLFQRIDITNPSASAVSLASSDSLEIALIGGLTQVLQPGNAWQPANGVYANVGGSTNTWPSGLTGANPDYIYIAPAGGNNLSIGVATIKKTGLVEATGITSNQIQYLQNASRLKLKLQGTKTSFPGSTTYTLYYVMVLRRNIVNADVSSMAADYINSDSPNMSLGTFNSYSYDEGAYQFTANRNAVEFTHTFTNPVTQRWLPCYKIANWTTTARPQVRVNTQLLADGVDYVAWVDTSAQVGYVKLLDSVVSSGAGAGQIAGTIRIDAAGSGITPASIISGLPRRRVLSARAKTISPPAGPVFSTVAQLSRGVVRKASKPRLNVAVITPPPATAGPVLRGAGRQASKFKVPTQIIVSTTSAINTGVAPLTIRGTVKPAITPLRSRIVRASPVLNTGVLPIVVRGIPRKASKLKLVIRSFRPSPPPLSVGSIYLYTGDLGRVEAQLGQVQLGIDRKFYIGASLTPSASLPTSASTILRTNPNVIQVQSRAFTLAVQSRSFTITLQPH